MDVLSRVILCFFLAYSPSAFAQTSDLYLDDESVSPASQPADELDSSAENQDLSAQNDADNTSENYTASGFGWSGSISVTSDYTLQLAETTDTVKAQFFYVLTGQTVQGEGSRLYTTYSKSPNTGAWYRRTHQAEVKSGQTLDYPAVVVDQQEDKGYFSLPLFSTSETVFNEAVNEQGERVSYTETRDVSLPEGLESFEIDNPPTSGNWSGRHQRPSYDGTDIIIYTVEWNLNCASDCVRQ